MNGYFRKRGFVLVVVLAVLAMLTLVGIAFVSVSRMGTDTARSYLDLQRAKFLAESGIHHIVSRIQSLCTGTNGLNGLNLSPREWVYWGNNNTETGNPNSAFPLRSATNPSFAYEDEDPQNHSTAPYTPKQIKVDGSLVGFTDYVTQSTYALYGDIYSVKVIDVSGQLYINEGIYGGVNHPYNTAVIRRILNRLGQKVGFVSDSDGHTSLGDAIITHRPTSGYREKKDLLKYFSKTEFEKFRDFVTVYAWLDTKVVNPVPLSSDADAAYRIFASGTSELASTRPTSGGSIIYRHGRGRTYTGATNPNTVTKFYGTAAGSSTSLAEFAVYGWDELATQYIETTARAPINVNSAPKEVLVSLLSDLEGFFVMENRRVSPLHYRHFVSNHGGNGSAVSTTSGGLLYNTLPYFYTGTLGTLNHGFGEIGVLFRTTPINGPGVFTVGSTNAEEVADAIINRRNSTPFTSWQDFNFFIDSLVGTTIQDPRAGSSFRVYNSYHTIQAVSKSCPSGTSCGCGDSWCGGGFCGCGVFGCSTTDSASATSEGNFTYALYKSYASRAIADVIKSNFNPNLHLNELNPDLNLAHIVDKTDLIKNSTEFCFFSSGIFEIESLGRVLKPDTGSSTLAAGVNNITQAEFSITALVRLYDLYRETAQKEFIQGSFSATTSPYNTNNYLGSESGPEPVNSVNVKDNEWEGYVRLSTIGTSTTAARTPAEAGTIMARPAIANTAAHCLGSLMHTHLDYDFGLHSSSAGVNEPLTKTSTSWNFQDLTESAISYTSPYAPAYNSGRYHLSRTYTWTGAAIAGTKYASSDLRVDGSYSERSSALVYHSQGGNLNTQRGTISYWLKAGYEPSIMGKRRFNVNLDRGSPTLNDIGQRGTPFYHSSEISDRNGYETSAVDYFRLLRPGSMSFGYIFYKSSGTYPNTFIPNAAITPTMNHEQHTSHGVSLLDQVFLPHKWMHITVSWDMGIAPTITSNRFEDSGIWATLYINGRELGTYKFNWYAPYNFGSTPANNFLVDFSGGMNPIVFGCLPGVDGVAGYTYRYRNYPADATFDEIYVWDKSVTVDTTTKGYAIDTLWKQGRYYKENDAIFTSRSISLGAIRQLPDPAPVTPPSEEIISGSAAPYVMKPTVIGISWTAYGTHPSVASVSASDIRKFKYGIYNYAPTMSGGNPALVTPEIRVSCSLDDGASWVGPFVGDFGTINKSVSAPYTVRYKVELDTKLASPLNDILLDSPVFDDVTIYYALDIVEFLSWTVNS